MKKIATFFGVLICMAAMQVPCATADTVYHKALPQASGPDTICALPDGGAVVVSPSTGADEGMVFVRLDTNANIVFEKTVENFANPYYMRMAAGNDYIVMYGDGLSLFDMQGNRLWDAPWAKGHATYALPQENGLLVSIGTTLYHVGLDGIVLREHNLAPERAYSGNIMSIQQTDDGHLLIGGQIRMLPDGYDKEDITEDDEGQLYLPDGSSCDLPFAAWALKATLDWSVQWTYSSNSNDTFIESFERVNDLHLDANGNVLLAVEGRSEGYGLAFLRRLDGETGKLTGYHRCEFGTDFSVIDRIFTKPDGNVLLMGMAVPDMAGATLIVPDGSDYVYEPGSWDCATVASLPDGTLAPTDFVQLINLAYPHPSEDVDGSLWMVGSTEGHSPTQAVKYQP